MGLPAFKTPLIRDEAIRYLEMASTERASLTPEDCAEAQIVLSQWATHVSRAQQREETNSFLLEEEIQRIISPRLGQQRQYASVDERRALAIREDTVAQRLELQRLAAVAKAKRLSYIATHVGYIAKAYRDLADSRRRHIQYGD
jgi:hypothetical protein